MKNLLRTIWVIHGLMSALFACAVVVALQTAETIIKEEVICHADISTPTRVRRFLLWFFVLVHRYTRHRRTVSDAQGTV